MKTELDELINLPNKENNRKIAKYMGAIDSHFGDYMIFTVDNPQSVGKINHSEILYDKSWDWLMPVVEKIGKYEYERFETENGFETYEGIDTAYPRTFNMLNSQTGDIMVRFNRCGCFEAPTLFEATYLAVLDFIDSIINKAL